jgi:hypothetical protein
MIVAHCVVAVVAADPGMSAKRTDEVTPEVVVLWSGWGPRSLTQQRCFNI